MDSPSHWSTVSEVTEEIYTVKNLAASSTVIFVVRARNHHGLSPPSPMSKPMKTSGSGSLSNLGGLLPSSTEPDLATVRLRLSQRIVELKEALVAGSRKVKLLWEVNQFFLFFVWHIVSIVVIGSQNQYGYVLWNHGIINWVYYPKEIARVFSLSSLLRMYVDCIKLLLRF